MDAANVCLAYILPSDKVCVAQYPYLCVRGGKGGQLYLASTLEGEFAHHLRSSVSDGDGVRQDAALSTSGSAVKAVSNESSSQFPVSALSLPSLPSLAVSSSSSLASVTADSGSHTKEKEKEVEGSRVVLVELAHADAQALYSALQSLMKAASASSECVESVRDKLKLQLQKIVVEKSGEGATCNVEERVDVWQEVIAAVYIGEDGTSPALLSAAQPAITRVHEQVSCGN